ncbi:MAG: PH domain-containing protein [Bacteroidetes bacterium]|nr:PH domain-containing protein [Bacteroidota bacterium]
MKDVINTDEQGIWIRPAAIFALIKVFWLLLVAEALLLLAWRYLLPLIWISLFSVIFAGYRYLYIRRIRYIITDQYLQVRQGLFFKRTDTIELFRIKDYVLLQPLLLQLFRLMDVQLKTTDPENGEVWLRGIPRFDIIEILRERVLATRRNNRVYELN